MVLPWRAYEEIQITAETYSTILKEHLEPWFKRKRIVFRRRMMFMKDNAAYHSTEKTIGEYLQLNARLLWTSPYEVACLFSGYECNWKYIECLEEASWTPIFFQRCIVEVYSGCCTSYYCCTDPNFCGIYGKKAQDHYFKLRILHTLLITIFKKFQMLNANYLFSYC